MPPALTLKQIVDSDWRPARARLLMESDVTLFRTVREALEGKRPLRDRELRWYAELAALQSEFLAYADEAWTRFCEVALRRSAWPPEWEAPNWRDPLQRLVNDEMLDGELVARWRDRGE